MKAFRAFLDPFTLTALLLLGAMVYTYYNSFVWRNFPVFTTEEEIEAAIESEFPLFVDYL